MVYNLVCYLFITCVRLKPTFIVIIASGIDQFSCMLICFFVRFFSPFSIESFMISLSFSSLCAGCLTCSIHPFTLSRTYIEFQEWYMSIENPPKFLPVVKGGCRFTVNKLFRVVDISVHRIFSAHWGGGGPTLKKSKSISGIFGWVLTFLDLQF